MPKSVSNPVVTSLAIGAGAALVQAVLVPRFRIKTYPTPRLYMIYENLRDGPIYFPDGYGWPPSEVIELFIGGEPIKVDNEFAIGPFRSIGTLKTDRTGSFGFPYTFKFEISPIGPGNPPPWMPNPTFLARNVEYGVSDDFGVPPHAWFFAH